MSKGYSDNKEEGPLEIIGLTAAMLAIVIILAWVGGSRAIVATFTPFFLFLGKVWQWMPLPGDNEALLAAQIYRDAARFTENPGEVHFFEWVNFVNLSIGPLVLTGTLAMLVWMVMLLKKPPAQVTRRFSKADQLMRELSYIFTGTAPILHIRKDLAKHTDPFWARQRFPEEVLLQDSIGGKRLVTGSRNDPQSLRIHLDRVQAWMDGFDEVITEGPDGKVSKMRRPNGAPAIGRHANGRWVSRTLGVLAVRLADPGDRAQFRRMPKDSGFSFADRFTPTGKVMFAMLCAHAFGLEQGIKDAHLARDQLNNSCRGTAHGLPNLTVAQWLYDKYRTNDLAHKLFAVHQWEHTYLYELFIQAKRNGKMPDSEFRWLKPTDRVMWYVLNTVGRFTPHTDSAAAFSQHAYERGWARRKRWPLRMVSDDKFEPSVMTNCAVEALELEFTRYRDGEDENDNEWWKDNHQWLSSNPNLAANLAPAAMPPAGAAAEMANTAFDAMQAQAAASGSSAMDAAKALARATNMRNWGKASAAGGNPAGAGHAGGQGAGGMGGLSGLGGLGAMSGFGGAGLDEFINPQ